MAISVAGSNKYLDDSNVSTISGSFTISGGARRKLIVFIAFTGTAAPGTMAPTYNGVALTKVAGASGQGLNSNYSGVWTYYLDEASLPAAGSYTLSSGTISNGPFSRLRMYAVEVTDAATGAPEAAALNTWTANATNITQSITTVSNGALVLSCGAGNATATLTYGAGQTEVQSHQSVSLTTGVTQEVVATAGADTQGITYSVNASRGAFGCIAIAQLLSASGGRRISHYPRGVFRAVR